MVRRLAIKNLTDGPHRLVLQRIAHRLENGARRRDITGDPVGREAEWPQKPTPDWPLVISAIALPNGAAIVRLVCGVSGCQRTQPERREKVASTHAHNSRLILRRERTMRQADSKDLVGPDAGIIAIRAINDIV